MQNLWKSYLEWDKKREQKHFEWWVKKREKGHPRFVLSVAFAYCTAIICGKILMDYYYEGQINWWDFPFKILIHFTTGVIIGAITWWDNERKYEKRFIQKNIS